MSKKTDEEYLSKRLQQIMDLVYERGRITAVELEQELPGSLSNSTVRTQLRTLEERGHLRHEDQEGRFVYFPTRLKPNAAKSAMQRFLKTFVSGSAEQALTTLLSAKESELSDSDLVRLQKIIEDAKSGRN
ncbi:MAG TPA: BlaI/MecI/CopY family transcriptional regulator [Fimbriimonadaceae bacterium]|jgi:predicted transcriptional regulator